MKTKTLLPFARLATYDLKKNVDGCDHYSVVESED